MLLSAINRALDRARNDEAGFTLIELLVVVIIIGILAAIAIPTFLNQRKKGWESAVKSDLRNYAVIMETHLTETGTYADTTTPAVTKPAPVVSDGVSITAKSATVSTYCLEGKHEKLTDATDVWNIKPGSSLAKGACT